MPIEKEPTYEKNLNNMTQCLRWNSCNIPKCHLDYWMLERTELPEEEKCVLLKLLGKNRTKRMAGILSPKMKTLLEFVWEKNKKSE